MYVVAFISSGSIYTVVLLLSTCLHVSINIWPKMLLVSAHTCFSLIEFVLKMGLFQPLTHFDLSLHSVLTLFLQLKSKHIMKFKKIRMAVNPLPLQNPINTAIL